MRGRVVNRDGVVGYRITVRGSAAGRKVTARLRGVVGDEFGDCRYRGPKGRETERRCAMVTTVEAGLVGRLVLNPVIDCRGRVAGDGFVVTGFGNDSAPGDGSLRGKLDLRRNTLRWVFRSGRQRIRFRGLAVEGDRGAEGFVGTAKLRLPPEHGTVDVPIVASLFRLQKGCPGAANTRRSGSNREPRRDDRS